MLKKIEDCVECRVQLFLIGVLGTGSWLLESGFRCKVYGWKVLGFRALWVEGLGLRVGNSCARSWASGSNSTNCPG